MPNIKTITLIHAITQGQSAYGKAWYQDHKDWKKDYNAKYYQQHKDQWKIYNQSNATPAGGASLRPREKNVTGEAKKGGSYGKSVYRLGIGSSKASALAEKYGADFMKLGPKGGSVGTNTSKRSLGASAKDYATYGPSMSSSDWQKTIKEMKSHVDHKRIIKSLDARSAFRRQLTTHKRVMENTAITFSNIVDDMISSKNFGSNWVSGAKSVIDKGKSIFNKLFGR